MIELLHAFFIIQRVHLGISHLWPSINLQNKKTTLSSFKLWSRQKKLEKKILFCKEYYFLYYTTIFLILINILFTLFSYCFANFAGPLWNLCIQISSMFDGISLPLISFVRRLISTTLMISKRTQVVHVNKDNDKIIIA